MPVDPIGGIVRNLFTLRQLENRVYGEVDGLLRDLFDELAGRIAALDPGALEDPRFRALRLEELFRDTDLTTRAAYEGIRERMTDRLAEIGVQQGEFAAAQLARTLGAGAVGVDIATGVVGEDMIRAIVRDDPMQGAVLAEWTDRQGESVAFRVRRQVQLGMAQNEGIDDLVRRVRGRRAGYIRQSRATGRFVAKGTRRTRVRPRYVGGVLQATTREAEALVRTAVNHIGTRAHLRTYQANADVTERFRYTATLDSRTSFICMSLDGQEWAYDDPEARFPPQHFNCRSIPVPVIKWEELGIAPPAEGTRASADGQVPGETTYEQWLRDQPKSVQDEILGPARARLFRARKVGLRDLVRKDNRVVTVGELRERAA